MNGDARSGVPMNLLLVDDQGGGAVWMVRVRVEAGATAGLAHGTVEVVEITDANMPMHDPEGLTVVCRSALPLRPARQHRPACALAAVCAATTSPETKHPPALSSVGAARVLSTTLARLGIDPRPTAPPDQGHLAVELDLLPPASAPIPVRVAATARGVDSIVRHMWDLDVRDDVARLDALLRFSELIVGELAASLGLEEVGVGATRRTLVPEPIDGRATAMAIGLDDEVIALSVG